jgi:hypothetical protein
MKSVKEYVDSFRDDSECLEIPNNFRENPIVELSKEDRNQIYLDVTTCAYYQFEQGNIKNRKDESLFIAGALSVLSSLGLGNSIPNPWMFNPMRGLPICIDELKPANGQININFSECIYSACDHMLEASKAMQKSYSFIRPYVGNPNPHTTAMLNGVCFDIANARTKIDSIIEWFGDSFKIEGIMEKERLEKIRHPEKVIPLKLPKIENSVFDDKVDSKSYLEKTTIDRLTKNIDITRGIRNPQEVTKYLNEQMDILKRSSDDREHQILGRINAVQIATSNNWSVEKIKEELIQTHIKRLKCGKEKNIPEYLLLFGTCEGYCWLIKNEDNYYTVGGAPNGP